MKFKLNDQLFHVGKIEDWSDMISIHICEVYEKPNRFNHKYKVIYTFINSFNQLKTMNMGLTNQFITENFIVRTQAVTILFKK